MPSKCTTLNPKQMKLILLLSDLLEPCAVKVASTVLRGGEAGDGFLLPDKAKKLASKQVQEA